MIRLTPAERLQLIEAFQDLCRLLCRRVRIDDYRSPAGRRHLMRALRAKPSQLSDVLSGHRGSYDLLRRWAARTEVHLDLAPDGAVGLTDLALPRRPVTRDVPTPGRGWATPRRSGPSSAGAAAVASAVASRLGPRSGRRATH